MENKLSGAKTYDWRIYYDKSHAEAWDDFLLSPCVVLNFSNSFYKSNAGSSCFYCYYKDSTDSVLGSSGSNVFAFYSNWGTAYRYSSGISYSTSDSDMYLGRGYSFDNSILTAENDDYAAPALPTGKAMQINLNFRAGASDDTDELPAAIYSAAADPTDTATGWALTYDVVDADDDDTTTEPDENTGDDAEETSKFLPSILDSIKALPEQIAEKASDLFSLDEDLVTEITDKFKSKFAFLSVLNQFVNDLFRMTPETEPPVIYIHLENAESKYGYQYGGQEIALDFAWYQKYKASVDGIIGGFLWLGYLWALFKKAPAIINGAELSNEGVPPMQNLEYINPLRLNGKIGKKRRK